MKNKMLHELIQMAKEGKKFEAKSSLVPDIIYNQEYFNQDSGGWKNNSVITPWECKEIREPEVLNFKLDCTKVNPSSAFNDEESNGPSYEQWNKMRSKKWKIVATEILDE